MTIKPLRGARLNVFHPLARGLVGCWLFNEGCGDRAYDMSGYGNHGILTNMLPNTQGWQGSEFGVGLRFDGTDDYVNCGSDASLEGMGALTMSVRFKANVVCACRPISKSSNVYSIALTAGGEIQVLLVTSVGLFNKTTTNVVYAVDNWCFAAVTYNGSTVKCYVNGSEEALSGNAHTGTINVDGHNLNIGRYWSGVVGSQYFNGAIDEVLIYNRALNASEIHQLYRDAYAMFEPVWISGVLYPEIAAVSRTSNLAMMQVLMR